MARPHGERFTEEQVADMVQRYQAGESRLRLARTFGSRPATIRDVLVRQGVTLRDEWTHKLTTAQQVEITRRYNAGELVTPLCEEYGISAATARAIFKRVGGVTRLSGRWRVWHPEEIEQMRQWSAEGVSQQDIAHRLHTFQGTVSRLMREHGVDPAHGFGHARGERHGSWKGGRSTTWQGYTLVLVQPDSPYASMRNQTGYVLEHRLVMAQALGRPLDAEETVHHVNGDRQDNRLENLQLRTGRHGKHSAWRCAECGSHNIVPAELDGPG